MAEAAEVYDLLRKVRMDLTNAQGKITEAFKVLNELHIEDKPKPRCPQCGIVGKSQRAISEHVYWTHDGPEPAHFALIEARSNDLETTDEAPLRGARKAES